MKNIYKEKFRIQNKKYAIRNVSKNDKHDLLEIYSDKNSVPFFNSDNCHGDTFYYDSIEKIENALKFWSYSYKNGWFTRLSIIDREEDKVIGTFEVFLRRASDSFNGMILMRLDLKSEYEKKDTILELLQLFIPKLEMYFGKKKVATKGFNNSTERIKALQEFGFKLSSRKLIGTEDNKEYGSYYVYKI